MAMATTTFSIPRLNANDRHQRGNSESPSLYNRRQQFGGTLGGPIVHDRLFSLGNYEGQVRNESVDCERCSRALVGLSPPSDFFANNPGVAAQVQAATGSFPRSFQSKHRVSGKSTAYLMTRNTFSVTYNYQRFRSPHGYFNIANFYR